VLVAAGLAVGLRPLSDNSFLTHLATGRLILERGSIPTADPYSFTAPGEPWVVQSWLASVLYGSTEAVAGGMGLRLLTGALVVALVLLAWRLLRPATSLVLRFGVAVLFLTVGAGLWAERPLLLGLLALGAVVLVGEGGLDPRWLVPIGWVWVNVHGSFPLGVVYLAVVLAGRWLDGDAWALEWRALRWMVLGLLVGALNPVGPRLLVFPIELLGRQDVLANVVEWRSPTFDGLSERAFLLQLVLAVVLLVRRPSYRRALVVAVFGAAALLGARNLVVASLVLLPGMAEALPRFGALRTFERARPALLLGAFGAVALLLVTSFRLGQADFDLRAYPVDALGYLEEIGVDIDEERVAAPDTVGNFVEVTFGAGERVFYDDRFDMFPEEVSADHLSLARSDPAVDEVLDRYAIDVVIWDRTAALTQRLLVDPDWRLLYTDPGWSVLCRRGADLGDDDRC
jgi:hypothetical protein